MTSVVTSPFLSWTEGRATRPPLPPLNKGLAASDLSFLFFYLN